MARRVRKKLTCLARGIVGNGDEAEDVAQETLLRMWILRDRIEAGRECDPLAMTIARNLCLSRLKEGGKEEHLGIDCVADPFDEANPQRKLEEEENRRWLEQQMDGLPSGQLAIMRMKQGDGMSIGEIARTLDMREDAVRQQLCKARRKLLKLMNERR